MTCSYGIVSLELLFYSFIFPKSSNILYFFIFKHRDLSTVHEIWKRFTMAPNIFILMYKYWFFFSKLTCTNVQVQFGLHSYIFLVVIINVHFPWQIRNHFNQGSSHIAMCNEIMPYKKLFHFRRAIMAYPERSSARQVNDLNIMRGISS